jgi:hypothetical protein
MEPLAVLVVVVQQEQQLIFNAWVVQELQGKDMLVATVKQITGPVVVVVEQAELVVMLLVTTVQILQTLLVMAVWAHNRQYRGLQHIMLAEVAEGVAI